MIKTAEERRAMDYVVSVWRKDEGFFENLLRCASYFLAFVPGLGLALVALDKIGSYAFGLSIEDFGKWIDGRIGPVTGQFPSEEQFVSKLSAPLNDALSKNSGTLYNNGRIVKRAFFFGLLKTIGSGKVLVGIYRALAGLTKFLFVVFSATAVNELVKNIDEYKQRAIDFATEEAAKKHKSISSRELRSLRR
jgi:hypothetical protein